MPYYYLISEVPDSRDDPIPYDIRNYKKPKTINLLLPSVHASRGDNVLVADAGSGAAEAVRDLQAWCRDSPSWPSSEYCDGANNDTHHYSGNETSEDSEPTRTENDGASDPPTPGPEDSARPPGPVFAKYRPPFWAYDSIRPELLEAARALFYERRRQQAMYAGAPWGHHSHGPRCPSEYELFAAWASLPRADKLAYVAEVSGSHSTSAVTSDSLSTQRAVTSLLASCPDSCSWPSFQFSRLQAQQRPPPHPLYPPRPYHSYHHYQPQPPVLPNPLPFKLD